jgi:hypothetical protein
MGNLPFQFFDQLASHAWKYNLFYYLMACFSPNSKNRDQGQSCYRKEAFLMSLDGSNIQMAENA